MKAHREPIQRLIEGCRILAEQDILDAYGHLSARISRTSFLISRGMSPALVTKSDFLVMDVTGKVLAGEGAPNVEWPIHAGVYRARPDVGSVLHSHARLSRVFSLSPRPFRGLLTSAAPEWQAGLPLYEDAGLVTDAEKGDRLAAVLGRNSAALLRGHGDVVAAGGVVETVLKSIALKQNQDVFHEILCQGGEPRLWTKTELAAWATRRRAAPENRDGAKDRAPDRVWDYYLARAEGRLAFPRNKKG
jgi:ribulose-5-phosphate 4-epimerase/fuculose-1-phosphate aldolase